jgi:hypothetical protein
VTKRRLAAYAAGSLATLVLGPVLAVEVWYRSLLPATLPQPSSDLLPPLVRSALWVELRGQGPLRVRASRPFLLGGLWRAVRATDLVGPSDSRLLPQLARYQVGPMATQGELRRAVSEAAMATWLSRHWTAEQALDTYGALVWIGRGQHGLRSGSTHYFQQPLEALPPDAAILLVAITRSPGRLDPACHPDRAREARDLLVARMVDGGWLDLQTAAHVRAAPVAVKLDCQHI